MPKDPSKYDTMRLIAGIETTGCYSVDDILEEFSEPNQVQEEQELSAGDQADIEQEVHVEAERSAEVQTPMELADSIAQAVATAIGQPTEEVLPVDEEEPVERQEPTQTIEPEAPPVPPARSIPDVKTVKDPELQKAPKENRKHSQGVRQKSNASSGVLTAVGEAVSALRTMQRSDLPSNKTSLKAAEKSNAMLVRISGMMAPVRYIILLLMALSLAGRRFSWMTLGFLGGTSGVTIAMVCAVLALVTAWQSILKIIRDVLHLRFTFEPILLLTTLMSLIDTAVRKNTDTLLPLLVMSWCLTGTASLMTSRANFRALRTVIVGRSRKAVRMAENQWEHTDCIGKAPASTAGFVRRQEEMDTFHSGWSAYSLLLLAAGLIVSAYLTAKTQGNYFSILVTLMTVAMPVSLVICCARPYELLVRIMNGAGAPAGWAGIKTLSGKKAILIYDDDLFPKETIGHKGVRVYGNQTPRLLTSYAASLVLRADNGLGNVFTQLLREMDGRIYDVGYFQVMDAGLAGRINGVTVALGTYNFMQLLGAMPPSDAPKNGVYIAINGELAGVFAIRYRVRSGAPGVFARLTRDRSLTMLVATRNFCVNPSFLRKWFKVPVAAVVCPKLETRFGLSQPGILARGVSCGFVTKDGVAAYGRLVAGSRRVYRMGLMLTLLSVILSVALLVLSAAAIAAGGTVWSGAKLLMMQLILFLILEFWARFTVR